MPSIFDVLIANKTGGGAAVLQLLQDERLAAQGEANEAERAAIAGERSEAVGRSAAALGLNAPDIGFLAQFAEADPDGAGNLIEAIAAQRAAGATGGGGGGQVGVPSPKDFTVESLGQFQRSGRFEDLERRIDPLQVARANLAQDRLEFQQFMATRPPQAQIDKWIGSQQQIDMLDNVVQRSDRSFFGYRFDTVGEAAREYGRRFGGEEAIRFNNFWREYDRWVLQIRKDFFGSQFTPNEERAFNRLIAKPSDSYAAGLATIQQQRQMVKDSARRQKSVLEDFGFKVPETRGIGDIIDAEETGQPVEVFNAEG